MSTPPREVPPFLDIFLEKPCGIKKTIYLCTRKPRNGVIAQLVEQRTENPCVLLFLYLDYCLITPKYCLCISLGIIKKKRLTD